MFELDDVVDFDTPHQWEGMEVFDLHSLTPTTFCVVYQWPDQIHTTFSEALSLVKDGVDSVNFKGGVSYHLFKGLEAQDSFIELEEGFVVNHESFYYLACMSEGSSDLADMWWSNMNTTQKEWCLNFINDSFKEAAE